MVHAGFSHGGDFLAAADMSGLIRVWKMASKEKVWEFETSDITVRRSILICTFQGFKKQTRKLAIIF